MLYNNHEIYFETSGMKFSVTATFLFRVSEIICYVILYRVLSKHNDEMAQNNIISQDLNQARRNLNLLSVYAQIYGFVAENVFIVITIIWRVVGRGVPETDRSRELAATILVVQFAFVSAVPIFASSELRPKFLALFKQ